MIRASRMSFNEHGEPRVTITLEGWSTVYRFADRMTELQCEFAAEGRKVLRSCKRKLGVKRYHAYQQHLHGKIVHR